MCIVSRLMGNYYEFFLTELIVISDSSDDSNGPSIPRVPVYGPSVQGLLDYYDYDNIEDYLSDFYFPSTNKEDTVVHTEFWDEDTWKMCKQVDECLDDSKGVSSKGQSITSILKEGPSIARLSKEPIPKELLAWYGYDRLVFRAKTAAPRGGRTGERTGRGGKRTGESTSGVGGRTGDQDGQVSDQGIRENGGVDEVPDISMVIAQQLQNLLPIIIAQVGNRSSDIHGDVRSGNVSNGRNGCSYKEFMACNPKDYDRKGGAIVYTRWIEKMESVQDMSGCGANQKVKYTAGPGHEYVCSHSSTCEVPVDT
ncbi:hypothetical protein Tco_1305272 [Tanacetum coccineum]